MTSEVALLNKSCIALAADSATTVTYWEKGGSKKRYFKGANKIFNLSGHHPVGLMTFASANLQGVPWEIVAKAYRQHIKTKSHDELPGYAQDFFDFIATNAHMFPPAVQEEQFKAQVDHVASKIIYPIITATKKANDADARKETFDRLFQERTQAVQAAPFVSGAAQSDADSAVSRFLGQIEAQLGHDTWYEDVPREALKDLATSAILGVYKEGFTSLQRTGLAFAGYGDKEYLPRMEVYRCSGMVLGKVLCGREKDGEVVISHQNASELVPLAMSEMIDTFIWGIGDSGLSQIINSFRKQTTALIEAVRTAGHIPQGIELDAFVESAAEKHVQELMNELHESHRAPLKRVIASLPFPEMAELAETLVFMESMKERVTSPEESVSGPIDVAVISKGDGFVWIKRKHYFDPKLNPRFFTRHERI